jgi:AraC-like DNA-binding protein
MPLTTHRVLTASADDPAIGLRALRALREIADRLEPLLVSRARAHGWSEQQIAEALGVSRRAVPQQHRSSGKDS